MMRDPDRASSAVALTDAVKLAKSTGRTGGVSDVPPPRIGPLKPSPVYDTYWRFAAERPALPKFGAARER